jgi:hypothetical protein
VASDGAARGSLWASYDRGEIGADELSARLRALDRAADDPAAVERALSGPVHIANPRRRRVASMLLGSVAVVALGAGLVTFVGDAEGPGRQQPGGFDPGVPITVVGGVAIDPVPPDCPELDDAVARFEALDEETTAANPALLSDPPALPEGYTVGVDDDITPGSDPNISMSVSAGTPLPHSIQGRTLTGELPVTMRAWVYDSGEAAGQAGMSVLSQGVCQYDAEPFDTGRPEILGSVVTGVIPTTAFASWRLAERRFTVAVEAGTDASEEATAAAQQLAATIAGLEYDAANTPPPPG